jgi:hypothetical protein
MHLERGPYTKNWSRPAAVPGRLYRTRPVLFFIDITRQGNCGVCKRQAECLSTCGLGCVGRKMVTRFQGIITTRRASTDGDLLMSGGGESLVRTWQTQSGSIWSRALWESYGEKK